MINKEDIQKAKQRAENIQTANLKSNEKSIQETQKFYETLETCIEILEQIKIGNNTITSNQKVLNDNMFNCSHEFNNMIERVENNYIEFKQLSETFNNVVKETANDIKRAIHNDITENIQNEIGNVRDNINSFNSEMGHNKTDILDMINTFKTELENNRKEYKKQMEKETYRVIFDNKILFFFFIIFLMIPVLYCINWQFNCIPFMQQIETPDIIKYIIIFFTGFIISIPIKAIIRYIFDK